MKLLTHLSLALMLAGCAAPAPLSLSPGRSDAPAAVRPVAAVEPATDHGTAQLTILWPTAPRSVQAIPYRTSRLMLSVFDASMSLVASASLVRQAGEASVSASLELPVASGLTLEAVADTPEASRVAVGTSNAFGIRRNAATEVSVTVLPVVRTLMGPGDGKVSGDGGPASQAGLKMAYSLAVGPDGTVYAADLSNHVLRSITPDGLAHTVIGSASAGVGIQSTVSPDNSGEGGLPGQATARSPYGVMVSPTNDLFFADALTNDAQRIRMVPGSSGTRFGKAMEAGHIYTVVQAATTSTNLGAGMVLDADGSLIYTGQYNKRIYRLAPDGTASVLVGNPAGGTADGTAPDQFALTAPWGLVRDAANNLIFGEWSGARLRMLCRTPGSYFGKAMEAGKVYTIMDGTDPNLASVFTIRKNTGLDAVQLPYPRQLALDRAEDLYFADNLGCSVYKVARATGLVTRVAGGRQAPAGTAGSLTGAQVGDEGAPLAATFNLPMALAIDAWQRLIVGDVSNYRLRVFYF